MTERGRNVTVAMIRNMTCAASNNGDDCPWCGGRGWKFVTLRRAAASGANADETGLLRRRRVPCDHCAGTTPETAPKAVS